MSPHFRKAIPNDIPQIWDILCHAIIRRKADGSKQWQDGYPNPEVVRNDIYHETGYVLTAGDTIIGYCALLINQEPAYAKIDGKWLTNSDFIVVHRIAISDQYLGQGFAQKIFKYIEAFAQSNHIYSIKADTNYDNPAILKIFEKLGYIYCGEVFFRGNPRRAYEKILHQVN